VSTPIRKQRSCPVQNQYFRYSGCELGLLDQPLICTKNRPDAGRRAATSSKTSIAIRSAMRSAVKLKPSSQHVRRYRGASTGIGLATARLPALNGAKVALAARNADGLGEEQDWPLRRRNDVVGGSELSVGSCAYQLVSIRLVL